VGRDELLALAARRWERAREGSGHLLLLSGEAGIGKTRLLGEIVNHIGDDARIIGAAAFPRDAEAAGSVLLELSDELRRVGLIEPARTLRGRLLDEVDGVGDPARRRRMLVGDLTEILAVLATEAPTLLRIEDLHWADELSLDVFDRLSSVLRTAPSMVLASYRSDELYPRTALRRWRARLLEQRLAEEVRLTRLDRAGTARMVEAITGAVPASTFVEALHERSDGIPLHIEELIAGGSPSSVPDTVAEAVIARVALLQAPTRAIVAAASVIGRSFDIDLLEAITEESTDVVDDALRELAERHIVFARGDGARFDFRHALIRDTIYDQVAPHRKRALHAAVARAADGAGFRDAYVSDHYERAHLPGQAYRRALAAAADAVRVSAHREAAELFRRAQRTAPTDTAVAVRAELHSNLAAELAAIDDNEGAATQLTSAMELYHRLGDEGSAAALVPRLMATRHLLGAGLGVRTELARDALKRLDALPDGGSRRVRAELLAALSAACMLDRRLDEAIDFGRQAAALATGPDALILRTNIDLTLGSVLVFAGRADEGWRLLEGALEVGERTGFEAETARAYRLIGASASVLVEYERADRWITDGLAYTERTERWNDHHYLLAHLAHVRWAEGDWHGSERAARQALADGGGITTHITALIVLGYLALGRNQLAKAREHLAEALVLGERMNELQRFSPALWGIAEVSLLEGHPDICVDLCERGYAASARVSDAAYLFPYLVTGVRALLALHEPSAAREWAERCGSLLRERGIPGTLPALDHAEGLIQLAEGHTGKARVLLERASAGWQARRRFWEGMQALIDLACCAARSRRPANAARLAAEAHDLAAAAGAPLFEAFADTVDGDRDAHLDAGLLTARELEVSRLVASGATNREIAERLTIAPKTASAHIEHILAKLGAARRTEIAAWVTRADAN